MNQNCHLAKCDWVPGRVMSADSQGLEAAPSIVSLVEEEEERLLRYSHKIKRSFHLHQHPNITMLKKETEQINR